ncbi:MAG: carboxypeptidase regulatory-like domain-containing protein [Planctomycetes bacterium]|nr:carboxypeptidase regulatory-like domain-containing protein [Planctomycetota bacterium]
MNRALPIVVALLLVAIGAWVAWSMQAAPPAPLGEPGDAGLTPAQAAAAATVPDSPPPDDADSIERVVADIGERADDDGDGLAVLHVHATWPDESPARDVLVTLKASMLAHALRVHEQRRTDADGNVTFTGVAAGRWSLRSDRGDRQRLDVEPGPQEVGFALAGGVTVAGTVVAPDDRPVAGASVWLQTRETGWSGGTVLATTRPDGSFELERIPPDVSLGAFADDFVQSPLVDLDTIDTRTPPARVTLRLGARGGQIVGVVVDAGDRPVANARVGAGEATRFLDYRGDRVVEKWSVRSVLTDENGAFRLVGLAAGATPVACHKPGYGFWRGECEVREHEDTELTIRVQRSGTIHGTVTDAAGKPLAGALLRAYDAEPGLDFVAGGQIDWDRMFGYLAASTDDQGRYQLRGVTAGTAHVFVQPAREPRYEGPVAHARAELEVPPGGRIEWSPKVDDGLVIEGVVLYRDGHPMSDVFVTLTDERTNQQHVNTNDREGVFRFVNLTDSIYGVKVQVWNPPPGAPPIQATGLRPGQGRVELRATFDKPVKQAPGAVFGRIDDPGLRIRNPKTLRVVLSSDSGWFRNGDEIVAGAFRFERVTPCRFRLTLMEDDAVLAHTDWFELAAGAQLDVCVLRTVAGGSVRVLAERGPGAEQAAPKLYLRHDDAPRSTAATLTGDELLVDNLTPGHYTVTGYGEGLTNLRGEVTVTPGAVADLPLTLVAGTVAKFAVWVPVDEAVSTYGYRVTDATGKVVRSVESKFGSAATRPYPVNVNLARGRYTIEFRAGALSGSAAFVVGAQPNDERVRIDLHRE